MIDLNLLNKTDNIQEKIDTELMMLNNSHKRLVHWFWIDLELILNGTLNEKDFLHKQYDNFDDLFNQAKKYELIKLDEIPIGANKEAIDKIDANLYGYLYNTFLLKEVLKNVNAELDSRYYTLYYFSKYIAHSISIANEKQIEQKKEQELIKSRTNILQKLSGIKNDDVIQAELNTNSTPSNKKTKKIITTPKITNTETLDILFDRLSNSM